MESPTFLTQSTVPVLNDLVQSGGAPPTNAASNPSFRKVTARQSPASAAAMQNRITFPRKRVAENHPRHRQTLLFNVMRPLVLDAARAIASCLCGSFISSESAFMDLWCQRPIRQPAGGAGLL